MAYCFPETEQEEMEEIDGGLVELEEPFVCDEKEGDEQMNVRGVGQGSLTERERALHHVYNATETEGKCYIHFSRWHHPLILPDDLQCRLCDHEAQDFEEFQLHARSHDAGPKGFVKTSDECMESVQESDPRGRKKQRERQHAAQEWRQGINESKRQISSLLRRFARKVDRRAAKN